MISQNETLENLKRKINVSESLHSIVKTMKLLSLVNVNQYERAVEALKDYYHTVDMGVDALLRNGPINISSQKNQGVGNVVMVIFGSDQGLCGKLNKQIVQKSRQKIININVDKKKVKYVTVGKKVKDYLESQGEVSQRLLTVPSSVNGINKQACQLVEILDEWMTKDNVDSMYLVYQKHLSKISFTPNVQKFLPINLDRIHEKDTDWKWHTIPWHRESHGELRSSVIRQYIYVSLYRAFAESLASENAARLEAMQNAEKNISEHLEELNGSFNQKRQVTITEELLDVVSGYEAMRRSEINPKKKMPS
jgi:F-type H+-transporting ATPase subunit gamma